jgi:hypothetical protein
VTEAMKNLKKKRKWRNKTIPQFAFGATTSCPALH